jgi:hypothetical protein
MLALAGVASAQTFDISWSSTAYGSGSAVFAATNDGSGQYTLTSIISGSQAGNPITLLGVNVFGSNDNLLFPYTTPVVDISGFSFFDGTNDFNISTVGVYVECSSADNPTCYYTGVEVPLDNLTVTTPEPSTILLLLSGFGALLILAGRKVTS